MAAPNPTNADSRVVVTADLQRKVLQIVFRGVISPTHVTDAVVEAQAAVPKLGAGFVLVTDLTELHSMDVECFRGVTRMMDLCYAAGLRQVIRIIPDPKKDIGFQLLALVHYRGKVPTVTCATRAEAAKEFSS